MRSLKNYGDLKIFPAKRKFQFCPVAVAPEIDKPFDGIYGLFTNAGLLGTGIP